MDNLNFMTRLETRKKSLAYAWAGCKAMWLSEINFRIHVIISLIVVCAGIMLKLNSGEWIAILFCIGLVISAEVFNTAVENISNIISTEIKPEIKLIKDISASGVLILACISSIIGCIIFLPKLNQIIISP